MSLLYCKYNIIYFQNSLTFAPCVLKFSDCVYLSFVDVFGLSLYLLLHFFLPPPLPQSLDLFLFFCTTKFLELVKYFSFFGGGSVRNYEYLFIDIFVVL